MYPRKYFTPEARTIRENNIQKYFKPLFSFWVKLPYVNIGFKSIYSYSF